MASTYRKLSDVIQVDESSGQKRFLVNGEWSFVLPDGLTYSVDSEFDGGVQGGVSLTGTVKPMVIRENYTGYKNPFNTALEPHYDFFGNYGTIVDCKYDNRFLEPSNNNKRTILVDEDDFYVDFYRSVIFPFGVDLTIRVRGSGIEAFNFSAVVDADSQEEYDHHVKFFDSIANSIQREGTKAAKIKKSSANATVVSDPDYIIENKVLLKYIGHKTDIVIPDGVKEIANNTFSGLDSIETLYVPEGVKRIGDRAFENCTSLREVTLPDSLEYLGGYAFVDCHSLTNVILGKNLASMENSVFSDCFQLQNVVIPPRVEYIDGFAFKACQELTHMVIPDGATMIGFTAFAGCRNLEYLYIPKSVKTIMDNFMGVSPFAGCSSLVIHCPKGSAAEDYAKSHNLNYETDNNPVLVTSPKRNSPVAVSSVIDDNDVADVEDVWKESHYSKKAQEWIEAHRSELTNDPDIEFTCQNFVFISLAENENFEQDPVVQAVDNAGGWCDNFVYSDENILVVDPEAENTEYDFCLRYDRERIDKIILLADLKNALIFAGYYDPDVVLFPGITKIKESAFSWKDDITSIVIPEGVTSIEEGAFTNCVNLKEVKFPHTLQTIGKSAFYGCNSLTSIVIPEGVTSIEEDAFYCCRNLKDVKLPCSLRTIGEKAFSSTALTSIVIPDGCSKIGADCFYNHSMCDAYIPDSVMEIGSDAFDYYNDDLMIHIVRGSYAEEHLGDTSFDYRHIKYDYVKKRR